ncbi:MAG: hypothetical protein JOZ83_08400 [Silvibacterium sp.]|nr:hypothetical protein [Silvibacterium sp.]
MAAFLLIDSRVALTFVELAERTTNPEVRKRRMKVARLAYQKIVDLMPHTPLAPEQRSLLSQRLAALYPHFGKQGESAE